MSPRLFLTVLVTLSLAPALHAQSLAEAAARRGPAKPTDVKKVYTNANLPAVAPPEVLSPSDAVIDRTKFDKVYAAGKAMALSGYAVTRTPLAREAMLTFKTEAFIAIDKATTKAETDLAKKYVEAQWKYELKLENVSPLSKWKEAFADASGTLDAANKIYLASPAPPR